MKKSGITWSHRQGGEISWELVICLALLTIMLLLLGMSDRQALPDERSWAQNEVQKLALSADQKRGFLADIAGARDKGTIQAALWKARWFGDQAYRERVQRVEAERQAYERAHENDLSVKVMGGIRRNMIWVIVISVLFFGGWAFRRVAYSV